MPARRVIRRSRGSAITALAPRNASTGSRNTPQGLLPTASRRRPQPHPDPEGTRLSPPGTARPLPASIAHGEDHAQPSISHTFCTHTRPTDHHDRAHRLHPGGSAARRRLHHRPAPPRPGLPRPQGADHGQSDRHRDADRDPGAGQGRLPRRHPAAGRPGHGLRLRLPRLVPVRRQGGAHPLQAHPGHSRGRALAHRRRSARDNAHRPDADADTACHTDASVRSRHADLQPARAPGHRPGRRPPRRPGGADPPGRQDAVPDRPDRRRQDLGHPPGRRAPRLGLRGARWDEQLRGRRPGRLEDRSRGLRLGDRPGLPAGQKRGMRPACSWTS